MCNITKANELFMKDLKATAKYEEAMTQAKAEADTKVKELEELAALIDEVETDEEITKEDVEIGLALIDTYRGYELDSTINEIEWINEHLNVSDILGREYRQKRSTVDELSVKLNMSIDRVKLLIRRGLGIKFGSDYQNEQKEYVESLIDSFNYGLYEDLTHYMKKAKIFDFYRGLLQYIKTRISVEPLSNNQDDLTFYVRYDDLKTVLKNNDYTGGLSTDSLRNKLKKLCDIKLLTNLEDEELTDKALYVANKERDNIRNTMTTEHKRKMKANRRNHYTLRDLSPQVQMKAISIIAADSQYGLRQKDKTNISLTLTHGEDHGVVAQRKRKVNQTKVNNFKNAAKALLTKQGYFTEEQLRIEYCKKDRNIKKDEAIVLTRNYLAGTVKEVNCIKTRVKRKIKEQYNLPKKIKSNSFIYVEKK